MPFERPAWRDINRIALGRVAPHLSILPTESVFSTLAASGTAWLPVLKKCIPTAIPGSPALPSQMDIYTSLPPGPLRPTHILAVFTTPRPGLDGVARTAPCNFLPIHGTLFAAHCADFPALPPSPIDPSTPIPHLDPAFAAAAYPAGSPALETPRAGRTIADLLDELGTTGFAIDPPFAPRPPPPPQHAGPSPLLPTAPEHPFNAADSAVDRTTHPHSYRVPVVQMLLVDMPAVEVFLSYIYTRQWHAHDLAAHFKDLTLDARRKWCTAFSNLGMQLGMVDQRFWDMLVDVWASIDRDEPGTLVAPEIAKGPAGEGSSPQATQGPDAAASPSSSVQSPPATPRSPSNE